MTQQAMSHFNPTQAPTHDAPRAYYDALAAQGLHYDADLRCWVAPSAETVKEVLSHTALFVRPAAEPVPATLLGTQAGQIFGALVRMNDGQRHAAFKPAIQRALNHALVPDLQTRAEAVAQRLASQLLSPVSGPAVTRFNYTLPSAVLADAYGFAPDAWPAIADEVLKFVRCVAPGGTPEELAAGIDAAARLTARVGTQMAAPGPLLARLMAEFAASGLPDHAHWVVANAIGLFFQACEGCAGLIGQAILLGDAADHTVDSAILVDAVLRESPPIQNTRRFVAEDTTVAGCPLHRGDAVLAILAAADEVSPHSVAFGHGVHACPGANWARAVAVAGVDQLRRLGCGSSQLTERGWRRSLNARVPEFY